MYVLHVFICTMSCMCPLKKNIRSLRMELQGTICYPKFVLRSSLQSSTRGATAHNHLDIFHSPLDKVVFNFQYKERVIQGLNMKIIKVYLHLNIKLGMPNKLPIHYLLKNLLENLS